MKFHFAAALALPAILASSTIVGAVGSCPPSLVSSTCGCPIAQDPIEVVSGANGSVSFEIKQSFVVGSSADWLAARFKVEDPADPEGDYFYCGSDTDVPPGVTAFYDTLEADAATGKATVEVFLADSSLTLEEPLAETLTDCELPQGVSNVCRMVFEVSYDAEAVRADGGNAMESATTRKLDAVLTPTLAPTPAPTKSPTGAPTKKPTPAPTVSTSPTSSPAPTTPQAPECTEESLNSPTSFCYDGRGGGGYHKGYTTCYILAESENCGVRDFWIEGGDLEFERCADVWKWFVACVESYGCRRVGQGRFRYGRPRTIKVEDRAWKNEWDFLIRSGGMSGTAKWRCNEPESAYGMMEFAKALWNEDEGTGKSFWETPLGTCESAAPSESTVPTASPAPTSVDAPSCPRPGMMPFIEKPSRDFFSDGFGTLRGANNFKVNKDCKYSIGGSGISGTVSYDLPADWFAKAAELFGARFVDNGAELTGEPVTAEEIVFEECNDGAHWCTIIKEGPGVKGADMIWWFNFDDADSSSLNTNQRYASSFAEFFKALTEYPAIWQTTSGNLECGSGPFCFDDKTQASCSLDYDSQTCGEADFIVDGVTDYERGSDVWPWFDACMVSYGCRPLKVCEKGYGTNHRIDKRTYSGNAGMRLTRGGLSGECTYECDSTEGRDGLIDLTKTFISQQVFNIKPGECTDSPTPSPTACTDSFLSKPPLNIGIVIDVSYSTYDKLFDGKEVGDVNKDGKANTILDAEIQAVLDLLNIIENSDELDNSNVDIGLITFDTSARYIDRFKPLNSANNLPNPELVEILTGIETLKTDNDVVKQNIGFTNFDDALDKAIDYYKDPKIPQDRSNLMVFLSDGKPNVRGDGDSEPWCPVSDDVDCSAAPANGASDGEGQWNLGPLSFCLAGNGGCYENAYKACALSEDCLGDVAATMYDSELAELDRLGVNRISIGVGQDSDVSKDSALYIIDNNPYRDAFEKEILPRQVLTSEDLSSVLRNLCLENTPNPTDQPSISPSRSPSESPTITPTTSPTRFIDNTQPPTPSPSSVPSQSPTVDLCEYTTISFNRGGDTFVHPAAFKSFGMIVTADAEEGGTVGANQEFEYGRAHYYDTGDEDAGTALIIKADGSDPTAMSTGGGSITITLDSKYDKAIRLDLFGAGDAMTIETVPYDEDATEGSIVDVEAFTGTESKTVAVLGIKEITVTFEGTGGIAQLNVCRNPTLPSRPSDTQDVFDTETGTPTSPPTKVPTGQPSTLPPTDVPTGQPTSAPTDAPTGQPTRPELPPCPADVNLLDKAGSTDYSDIPITIVSQDKASVTFSLSQTWTEQVQSLYVQYEDARVGRSTCIKFEDVSSVWMQEVTAVCMETVPITIVELWVVLDSEDTGDDAVVPRCCHPPESQTMPTVAYSFEVWCKTKCPADGEPDVALRGRNM